MYGRAGSSSQFAAGTHRSTNTPVGMDNCLPSLPPGFGDPNVDTADRALLQRLLRVAQDLQCQNDGQLPTSTIGSSTVEDGDMYAGVNGVPPMRQHDYAEHAIDGVDDDDEDYEYDDEGMSRDRLSEDPSCNSKASSPSTVTKDVNSSQTRPHAAVEKRYRRTVNTKLQQLHSSIPPSGKFSMASEKSDNEENEQAAKPVVLDKAIQYVTHLLETYRQYDNDIEELRRKVRAVIDNPEPQDIALRSPSDEQARQP